VRKYCSVPVTIAMRPPAASGAARSSVRCSRLWVPPRRMKGLGRVSRDTGQRRVPAPPDRTIGTIGGSGMDAWGVSVMECDRF